ncbi:hypothetical protein [Pseudomonas aeruginosa]|uniref:hypothetical protein n=1 Tax=Pseudomonas aeruginosa TaxID=287 RepID=UPI001114E01F|nr:hypothetical protein [Pseudomonas aeruginosa]HBO1345063.1 hypothetical protein [Pseudomonas aeruginosa]
MLLIVAPHAHGSGGCLMPRMSRTGIALVMVEWLEARGSKRKMACRRWKRRRAFGLRPVPASRHGHVASIPHAFAPGGAARSACGYVSDAAI